MTCTASAGWPQQDHASALMAPPNGDLCHVGLNDLDGCRAASTATVTCRVRRPTDAIELAVMKRGVVVALVLCGLSLVAGAAPTVITVNPSPLDAGTAAIGATATSPTGTLTSNNNVRVDLQVTNNCSGTGS